MRVAATICDTPLCWVERKALSFIFIIFDAVVSVKREQKTKCLNGRASSRMCVHFIRRAAQYRRLHNGQPHNFHSIVIFIETFATALCSTLTPAQRVDFR